ncbi:MAG: PrgI family protein, partial [Candidatus Levybacteria bacterium]|nr:PrgI family protein [Candidatus Levybacteria bacterium]
MDTSHPIPQDVTGFQFRLIGNMTVKQFAYIATGGILAVLTYYAPVFFLFKAVLIPIFGGTSLALAFLPIEGRPLDLMLTKFIKDVFSPTQYIYQKTGGALALTSLNIHPPQKKRHEKKGIQKNMNKQAQLTNFLHDLSSHKSRIDEREDVYLNSLFTTGTTPQIISMEDEIKRSAGIELTPFELSGGKQDMQNNGENSELEKEARAIKKELEEARQQEAALQNTNQSTEESHEHVNELERELGDIMTQKEQLEQEILETQEKAKDIKKVLAPPPPTGTMNVH